MALESTCRNLRLRQCTFAISNQRFQTHFQFGDVEILQQESSSAANNVTVTLRLIYALRALVASQFLHPPQSKCGHHPGVGGKVDNNFKGKKGFPVKLKWWPTAPSASDY